MKKALAVAVMSIFLGSVSTSVGAGDFDKQIKARQAVMQLYAFNLGILGSMAKGAVEYDADQASIAADNLSALASMNIGAMWPQGSGITGNEGITWAKDENWTEYPKAAEKGKAFKDAAANMASEAGNGLDALRGAMGPLGGSCKGCHDAFRAPKG